MAVVGRDVEAGCRVEDRAVVDGYATTIGCEESGDGFEGEGFARAGLAEEDCDSGSDLELGHEPEAAEREGDVDFNHRARLPARANPRKAIRTARAMAARTTAMAMAALASASMASRIASGMVWVRPATLPANMMVAPNSPKARAQAMTAPPASEGRASGTVMRRNVRQGRAPRVGGDGFEALVDALEAGAGGADVEGGGDEHLRQHDGGGGEGDVDPGTGQRAADGSLPSQEQQQGQAADDGGQDDGQVDDGVDQGAAGKASPGQEVGGGGAQGNDGHDRDGGGDERELDSAADEGAGESRADIGLGDAAGDEDSDGSQNEGECQGCQQPDEELAPGKWGARG